MPPKYSQHYRSDWEQMSDFKEWLQPVENDTTKAYSIYVKYIGEATVNWTEEDSEYVNGEKRYKTIEYVGKQQYFKDSQLLAGAHGKLENLNPGKYTYPFQYTLPGFLASSFSGKRGSVVYSVIGRVEFQGQSLLMKEVVRTFDVVAPFDLNKGNASVKEPIELEFEEVYNGGICGCFCSSDPVNIRVRLPVSAYCPGQAIPVTVCVDNNSSVEISSLIFELLTRERYRSQRPIGEYVPMEKVLTTVKKGSIMSGTTRNFTVDLVVPDFIAPNLEDCSIIDVGYFFRITIKLSGCNDDLQDEAEICLGLIPLAETVAGTYVHPLAHRLPLDPPPAVIPPSQPQVPQNSNPVFSGFPTVQAELQNLADGTSYVVSVNKQVISSDPSQNFKMGFQVAYPPGTSEVEMSNLGATFNQQFGLPNQQWPSAFDNNMKIQLNENVVHTQGFTIPITAQNSTFVPRGKSPVPSAPPM